MAISKEMLKKLLDNPASVSADDLDPSEAEVQPESIDDALNQKIEEPDQEYDMDPEIPEAVEGLVAKSNKNIAELPNKQYQPSPEVMDLVKNLKAPSPEGVEIKQDDQDVISDTGASMDIRKKALQKIKQKYLGK